MTDEEKNQLATLEARIRQLMFMYGKLKEKNSLLVQVLDKKELELQKLQHEYNELETCYTNLKQARIISITSNDVNNTKLRLSRLVREIDKCLALLNG